MYNAVLVRYDEISLKGKNRGHFENRLLDNIRECLKSKGLPYKKAYKIHGRMVVETDEAKKVAKELRCVFGISSLSPTIKIDAVLEEIEKVVAKFAKKQLNEKT
ncbi:MAG: tRNA 4-thiouridine(8) synthase ThiI, partial [Candidatus Diapherotrites archaeon]|nr:tRNA 4-thiouridine(8) synthase ThiI [Candidatus Diapherotrites archaeon]